MNPGLKETLIVVGNAKHIVKEHHDRLYDIVVAGALYGQPKSAALFVESMHMMGC